MPPTFLTQYQEPVLWIPLPTCTVTPTGLSPCNVCPSRQLWIPVQLVLMRSEHHIAELLPILLRFGLCGFRSPLLTVSQLISFPPGTKTFQFPGFPNLSVSCGSPIRKFLVQFLLTDRQDFSQLATSFIGVSSLVIHLIA